MKNKIFKLHQEFNHSEDTGADGFVIKSMFKSNKSIDFIYSRYEEYKNLLPTYIYIQSNFNIILKYDFPLIDPRVFVLSKEMLKLLSLDEAEIHEIPVILIDDTYFGKLFDENNNLFTEVPANTNYTSLVFKNSMDVMDYEKSVYTPSIIDPSKIGYISKMVIQEPLSGFKPIFKVKNDYTNVYVNQEMKNILEVNDIKGCVFEPVEVTPYDAEQ